MKTIFFNIRHIILLLLLQFMFIPVAHADQVVVTSGRVVYDPFGRAVRVYHPTVDGERVDSFSLAVDNIAPRRTEYDELDRIIRDTIQDNTVTTYEYSLVGNALKTTVTDAEGNSSAKLVNGSGKTVQSIQYKGSAGSAALTTSFVYDGIGRLVSVTDPEGNVTESTYDYGDRRTKVVHPASGETGYTYDRLGNVLTVQTANLKESGASISYQYELGRLTGVHYPEHPENDVSYRYGDENDDHQAKGRVVLRLDGTGGQEYSYDNMGNVSRTLRTVVVPNEESAIGTFETEFTYDSYGKLLDMTYPDGEKVCYWYDSSGQLTEVYIKKKDGVHYVEEIGYDKFGDRTYIRYGDKSETRYSYLPTTRRLSSTQISRPQVGSGPCYTLSRQYTYDDVGNITELSCTSTGGSTGSGTGLLQPPVTHQYEYDALYRLTGANGTTGTSTGQSALYSLTMGYDDLYRITSKNQTLSQTNVLFTGTLSAGYTLGYNYNTAPGRKFQMSDVADVNYRKASATVNESDKTRERHFYEYDKNGNITYVGTSRKMEDSTYRDKMREEKFRWDEENRLLAISQNGYVSSYWYDADGERVVKEHGDNEAVFVNSERSGAKTDTRQFTVYPSAYLSVHNGGWYTNHIYIGSERIASRLGTMDDGLSSYDGNDLAGSGVAVNVDYESKYNAQVLAMRDNYSHFGLPYSGEDRYNGTTINSATINNLSAPDLLTGTGAPRYYCMLGGGEDDGEESESNGHGQIPDSSPRLSGLNTNSGTYYYHSDHLGSSTLITDGTGAVSQQVEYLPYGEVFLERQRNTDDYLSPYRFNGKELDEETGLYYYGARYMNPRLSIWYATDPMQEKYPNISSYAYCAGNPVNAKDFDGDFPIFINGRVSRDSERGSASYWNIKFREMIKQKTGYYHSQFKYVDGDKGSWPSDRYKAGLKQGNADAVAIYAILKSTAKRGVITEQLQIISHSRGCAFASGYMKSISAKIRELANKDNLSFSYGSDRIIEYSINIAPHQSNHISYESSGTVNVNISHFGDLLSGNDAKGNVINIHSCMSGLEQHGHATFIPELNFILPILEAGGSKAYIKKQLINQYKIWNQKHPGQIKSTIE